MIVGERSQAPEIVQLDPAVAERNEALLAQLAQHSPRRPMTNWDELNRARGGDWVTGLLSSLLHLATC